MDTDHLLRELTDFLRIPSVSTNASHNADCRAAAEWVAGALFELLRREPERTRADAVLIADMAYVAPRWPAVYTTLRGLCYAEITVRTAKSDLHSGEFGGAAPNAHEELARLLGRLKTPDGKIHVPGLYAAVRRPSKRERATWKRLPFKEGEFLRHRVRAKALTGLKIGRAH